MRSYIKIIKLLPNNQLYKLFILVPLMGVSGVLEVASIASLIPLMSVALEPDKVEYWSAMVGLPKMTYQDAITYLVFLVIFSFVVKGCFGLFVYSLSYRFVANTKANYQQILFQGYLNKDFKFHLDNNSGDYLRNLTTECNAVEARFIMPSLVLLAEVIPLFFLVLFLFYLNPYGLALSSGLFVFFGFLVAKFNSKRLRELAKIQISSDGSIVKTIQQTFSSIREILIYNRSDSVKSSFSEYCQISANSISKGLVYNSVPKLVLEVVAVFCVFLIAFISYLSGDSIRDILIELGVFLATMIKILPSASKVVAHIQALSYAKPSIVNYLTAISSENNNRLAPQTSLEKFDSLEFKNVSFRYDSKRKVLDKISLKINSGDVVGIIGETGSGKSTLLNLILGLVNPSEGVVFINNKPMEVVKLSYWNKIGYVPQETYLIDDSIINNITFYRKFDNIRIQNSLELSSLQPTIEGLPDGGETKVGEAGCNLSGGQRQRVGLARALFNQPDLLILDEATSALDHITEKNIIDNLARIKCGKTILMIAHRESTLSICDYILKVENSQVSVISNK